MYHTFVPCGHKLTLALVYSSFGIYYMYLDEKGTFPCQIIIPNKVCVSLSHREVPLFTPGITMHAQTCIPRSIGDRAIWHCAYIHVHYASTCRDENVHVRAVDGRNEHYSFDNTVITQSQNRLKDSKIKVTNPYLSFYDCNNFWGELLKYSCTRAN